MYEFPLARSARLLVEQLDGDLLVYDQDADTAHALTDHVARVWQCCDGKLTVDEIASDLALDVATVARALDELATCDLLLKPIAIDGYSRRDAVKRVMKVGAAAASAPLIYSLAIGPAAAMATPVACGQVPCVGTGSNSNVSKQNADAQCQANPNCQATSQCSGSNNNQGGVHTYTGLCTF